MIRLKAIALAILLALPYSSISAEEGLKLELGLGGTRFGKAPNGYWYQDEFEHKLQLDSPAISLGIRGILKEDFLGFERISFRTGYTYLGKVKSYAIATSTDPDYYRFHYLGDKTPVHMSTWFGKGDVQGIYGSISPEIDMSPGYTIVPEIGGMLYWPRWQCYIPDMQGEGEVGSHAVTAIHKSHWQWTPVYGLGIRYKNTTISITTQRSEAKGDEFPAVYWGWSRNISIRHLF